MDELREFSPLPLRPLGDSGLQVSPLGLGTVKIGRNQQVKYPRGFELPDDAQVVRLLETARELGVNLIDTAPAYGSSMERLGRLMPGSRDQWVIVSKVGEFFEAGASRFDFSYHSTLEMVRQSLCTLGTDYLDAVLIHSDGDDRRILEEEGVVAALQYLKQQGLIRAHGLSGKTVEGGLLALRELDLVMVTCNPAYNDELEVLREAARRNKGVLIKKALASGHVGPDGVAAALRFVYDQPGVSSIIAGTATPEHLRYNVRILQELIAKDENAP